MIVRLAWQHAWGTWRLRRGRRVGAGAAVNQLEPARAR